MDASSQPPSPSPRPTHTSPLLAWTPAAERTLFVLLLGGLCFVLGRWSSDRPTTAAPAAIAQAPAARIDLNRATQAELRLLPGVGPNLAQGIVNHREQHGAFEHVDDLCAVSGVGPKAIERLRPWLFVADEIEEDRPLRTKPPAKATKAGKQLALTSPIDINRAETAELQKLPGIGPKLSQRIVDERFLRGPFKSVEELRRVAGIGAKTLDKLRPHVHVEPLTSTAEAR